MSRHSCEEGRRLLLRWCISLPMQLGLLLLLQLLLLLLQLLLLLLPLLLLTLLQLLGLVWGGGCSRGNARLDWQRADG